MQETRITCKNESLNFKMWIKGKRLVGCRILKSQLYLKGKLTTIV